MNFPDLDYELNGDPRDQIREIERKNREEPAQSVLARELVARVVANRREMTRQKMALAISRNPRKPRHTYAKRKPRAVPPPPEPRYRIERHWAQLLLDYVRRAG